MAGDITDPELSLGETEDVIATALALTCTTQRRSYMPVDDVLNGVQAGGNMPDDGSSTGLFDGRTP